MLSIRLPRVIKKDHEHIKSSGGPEQCLLIHDDWRTENSTIKTSPTVSETHSDCFIPSTTLFESVDLTSDERIEVSHQYIVRYPLSPGRILNNADDLKQLYFRQTIIPETIYPHLNQPSSKSNTQYMRDNNVANKTDSVTLKTKLRIKKLVPTSINQSIKSPSTKINLLCTHHHENSTTDQHTHFNTTIRNSRPHITSNRLQYHPVEHTNSTIFNKINHNQL